MYVFIYPNSAIPLIQCVCNMVYNPVSVSGISYGFHVHLCPHITMAITALWCVLQVTADCAVMAPPPLPGLWLGIGSSGPRLAHATCHPGRPSLLGPNQWLLHPGPPELTSSDTIGPGGVARGGSTCRRATSTAPWRPAAASSALGWPRAVTAPSQHCRIGQERPAKSGTHEGA